MAEVEHRMQNSSEVDATFVPIVSTESQPTAHDTASPSNQDNGRSLDANICDQIDWL